MQNNAMIEYVTIRRLKELNMLELFFSDLRREILHALENMTLVDASIRDGLQAGEAGVMLRDKVISRLSRAVSNYETMKTLTQEAVTRELDLKIDFGRVEKVRDSIEDWCSDPESAGNWPDLFDRNETALRDAARILKELETSTFIGELMNMKTPFGN
jgi:hypothetical protein